jgi:hypothetical protein
LLQSYFIRTIELGGHCWLVAVAPLTRKVIVRLEYGLNSIALSIDSRLICFL